MYTGQGTRSNQPEKVTRPRTQANYESQQVANIVKRYQELRSAVEINSTRFDKVGGSNSETDKEDILCALVDIDRAMNSLSPSQRLVIRLLKLGFQYGDIGFELGLSMTAVRFHARQGFFRLTSCLNGISRNHNRGENDEVLYIGNA